MPFRTRKDRTRSFKNPVPKSTVQELPRRGSWQGAALTDEGRGDLKRSGNCRRIRRNVPHYVIPTAAQAEWRNLLRKTKNHHKRNLATWEDSSTPFHSARNDIYDGFLPLRPLFLQCLTPYRPSSTACGRSPFPGGEGLFGASLNVPINPAPESTGQKLPRRGSWQGAALTDEGRGSLKHSKSNRRKGKSTESHRRERPMCRSAALQLQPLWTNRNHLPVCHSERTVVSRGIFPSGRFYLAPVLHPTWWIPPLRLRYGRNDIWGDVCTDSPTVSRIFLAAPPPHQSRLRRASFPQGKLLYRGFGCQGLLGTVPSFHVRNGT